MIIFIATVTLCHQGKPFCGCRRMSECFVKLSMYQGTSQIKCYERKPKYIKDKLGHLQAYPIAKKQKR